MSELANRNLRDPARYVADPDAEAAVEVARILQQPLLVTGPPGIGKTSLAEWVAHTLNREFIPFVAKSDSTATDLLYSFDAVRRFRDLQISVMKREISEVPVRRFLRFQALGRAIALTYGANCPEMQLLWDEEINRQPTGLQSRRQHDGYGSVVLIDEIDKAPRDVPNDLLTEFANMKFLVPEANQELSVQHRDLYPIVIATSNSEKALPDAFLRRCIFLHLSIPKTNKLREIIRKRLPELGTSDAERDATVMFEEVHTESDRAPHLRRKPSTAELIGLLQFAGVLGPQAEHFRAKGLKNGLQDLIVDQRAVDAFRAFRQWLSILFKTQDDLRAGREWLCKHWELPAAFQSEHG